MSQLAPHTPKHYMSPSQTQMMILLAFQNMNTPVGRQARQMVAEIGDMPTVL